MLIGLTAMMLTVIQAMPCRSEAPRSFAGISIGDMVVNSSNGLKISAIDKTLGGMKKIESGAVAFGIEIKSNKVISFQDKRVGLEFAPTIRETYNTKIYNGNYQLSNEIILNTIVAYKTKICYIKYQADSATPSAISGKLDEHKTAIRRMFKDTINFYGAGEEVAVVGYEIEGIVWLVQQQPCKFHAQPNIPVVIYDEKAMDAAIGDYQRKGQKERDDEEGENQYRQMEERMREKQNKVRGMRK